VTGQSFTLLSPIGLHRECYSKPLENALTLAALFLIYVLVITSWYFYHRSTARAEIRKPARFTIDIVLLFLYYLAFLSASDFTVIMNLLLAVFVGYSCWDGARVWEYYGDRNTNQTSKERFTSFKRSLGLTLLFTAILTCTLVTFWYLRPMLYGIYWAYWVILIVILGLYRWTKMRYAER